MTEREKELEAELAEICNAFDAKHAKLVELQAELKLEREKAKGLREALRYVLTGLKFSDFGPTARARTEHKILEALARYGSEASKEEK